MFDFLHFYSLGDVMVFANILFLHLIERWSTVLSVSINICLYTQSMMKLEKNKGGAKFWYAQD